MLVASLRRGYFYAVSNAIDSLPLLVLQFMLSFVCFEDLRYSAWMVFTGSFSFYSLGALF